MTLSYLNQCAMKNVITDESCSLSDIQDYFECIANWHEMLNGNLSIHT